MNSDAPFFHSFFCGYGRWRWKKNGHLFSLQYFKAIRMSLTRLRSILPPALLQTLRSQSIRAMGIGKSLIRDKKRDIEAGLERGRERETNPSICCSSKQTPPCRLEFFFSLLVFFFLSCSSLHPTHTHTLSRPPAASSQKFRLPRQRQRPGEGREGPRPGRGGPRPLPRAHGASLVRGPGFGLGAREKTSGEKKKTREERNRAL